MGNFNKTLQAKLLFNQLSVHCDEIFRQYEWHTHDAYTWAWAVLDVHVYDMMCYKLSLSHINHTHFNAMYCNTECDERRTRIPYPHIIRVLHTSNKIRWNPILILVVAVFFVLRYYLRVQFASNWLRNKTEHKLPKTIATATSIGGSGGGNNIDGHHQPIE